MKTEAMREGGKLLGQIKSQLRQAAKVGVTLAEIDALAEKLLLETGGKPAFKLVPGYHWSTCINVNDGIVHGIPTDREIQNGDLVTIDVGLFYKGFNTDTSSSFVVGDAPAEVGHFVSTGRKTLKQALRQVKAGNRIWDISHEIQKNIEKAGYSVVRNLTGHGVGEELHQEPSIPCFTTGKREQSPVMNAGDMLAIEVMYCQGDWQTYTEPDGWTISTKDGKLSAVFEETVCVTDQGCEILTQS